MLRPYRGGAVPGARPESGYPDRVAPASHNRFRLRRDRFRPAAMSAVLPPERLARLAKLLARCDSAADGEALAAVRAARSFLAQDGLSLADLARAWPAARHGVDDYAGLVARLEQLAARVTELKSDLAAERAGRETLFAAAVAELLAQERALITLEQRLRHADAADAPGSDPGSDPTDDQPRLPLDGLEDGPCQPVLFDGDDPLV